MYMSKLCGKTLRDIKQEYDMESQKLLIKSGMFRNMGPGIYSALPLGTKVLEKLLNYIGEGLEAEGFQRIIIPSKGKFEEIIKDSLKNDIKSYKDLPKGVYEIVMGEREKIKANEGINGSKEYIMIRGCSLHKDEEELNKHYEEMKKLIEDKFVEIGLRIYFLESYNYRNIEGLSHEIIILTENGNKVIYRCNKCGYMAIEEVADFYREECEELEEKRIEEVYTPNIKTIKELEEFMNIDARKLAKTLLVKAGDEIIAVVLRGDRDLNLYKLSNVLNIPVDLIQMADEGDIINNDIITETGFIGPVGLKNVKVIVDKEITKSGYMVTGANKKDFHLKNIKYGRDFEGNIIADISYIKYEDKCPLCKNSLERTYGIDAGLIYGLGNRFHKDGDFTYLDNNGKSKDVYGFSFNFDIYRLLSIIVEKNHDKEGIIWPLLIAPYHIIISVLNVKKEEQRLLGKKMYDELRNSRFDVLLDDRDERAGVKFKDSELLGIPVRIVVGRGAGENKVEYKLRWENDGEELKAYEALGKALKLLKSQGLVQTI